jgi:hypothetical protein
MGGPTTGANSAGQISADIVPISSLRGVWRMTTSRPTGVIIAPPIPWTTRKATKAGTERALPHRAEAIVKMVIAVMNTRRAPKRSAIQLLAGISTPSASM